MRLAVYAVKVPHLEYRCSNDYILLVAKVLTSDIKSVDYSENGFPLVTPQKKE